MLLEKGKTMTAIYGFTSKEKEIAFLFSDNLTQGIFYDESGKQKRFERRLDKIHIIGNRFAIAIIGNEITLDAIEGLKILNDPNNFTKSKDRVTSLDDLVNKIKDGTRLICKSQNKVRDYTKNQPTKIVILDCTEYELYEVDFGEDIPPNKLLKPTITNLPPDKLHFFALAAQAAKYEKNPPYLCINDDDINSFEKIEKLMDEIFDFHRNIIKDKKIKQNGITVSIGERGIYVLVKDDEIKYYSYYKTLNDFILTRTTGISY